MDKRGIYGPLHKYVMDGQIKQISVSGPQNDGYKKLRLVYKNGRKRGEPNPFRARKDYLKAVKAIKTLGGDEDENRILVSYTDTTAVKGHKLTIRLITVQIDGERTPYPGIRITKERLRKGGRYKEYRIRDPEQD